jgi:heme/copper-type cytochrome/quinol oxidase subunit 1
MLCLGYAGMPRRIQDYPWGFAGWHSVASFGHIIVLIGILNFIFIILLAIYLKRPINSKNKGFPFVSLRVSYLLLDLNYLKGNIVKNLILGRCLHQQQAESYINSIKI